MLSFGTEILNYISQCSRGDHPHIGGPRLIECGVKYFRRLVCQSIRLDDAEAAEESNDQPALCLISSSLKLELASLN